MLREVLIAVLAASVVAGAALAGEPREPAAATGGTETAYFASGCYWCTESDFDKVEGVVATTSGFMGGRTEKPTYEQVGMGGTGHVELVEVRFDPARVSYAKLLDHYWHHVDFQDGGGQFCDRGDQYRPAIFVTNEAQKAAAEESKAAIAAKFGPKPVKVSIEKSSAFHAGPDDHQDYYKKNPLAYQYYRWGCGRDRRIEALWQTARPGS